MNENVLVGETDEDISVVVPNDELDTDDDFGKNVSAVVEPDKKVESTDAVIEKITEDVKAEMGGELALLRVEARMKAAVRELVEQGTSIAEVKDEILRRMSESVERMEAAAGRLEARAKEAEVTAELETHAGEEVTEEPDAEAGEAVARKSARAYGLI